MPHITQLTPFAVEDTGVQLVFHAHRRGRVTMSWARRDTFDAQDVVDPIVPQRHGLPSGGSRSLEVEPGMISVMIRGLTPDTGYDVFVGTAETRVRTLASPTGPETARFATMSDLHLGITHFGLAARIRDLPKLPEPHALLCARAALGSAAAWGARFIIWKGDIVDFSDPEKWELAGELARHSPVPILAIPGNHEMKTRGRIDPFDAAARHGIELVRHVRHLDVPGLRLILANTARTDAHRGFLDHLTQPVCELAAAAPGPVMVLVHQHLQSAPFHNLVPPGIGWRESRRFLRSLAEANPDSLVTSGHTHRNRAFTRHGVVCTEVGSTKDYPGTWAGYAVHAGGIRQAVFRHDDRHALEWTQHTRQAVYGAWGLWSPGRLSERCFVHLWASDRPARHPPSPEELVVSPQWPDATRAEAGYRGPR